MSKVNVEDIKGYWIDGAVVCLECVTDEEEVLAKESDLILDKDLEDEDVILFCDRCGKRLPV